MKRRGAFLCIILLLLFSPHMSACKQTATPREILTLFCERYPLPAGQVYHSDAEAGEAGYFDPDLFAVLFGREDGGDDREDVVSFSLFLGSALTVACETGVFLCPDSESAAEVVGMLKNRIALVGASTVTDTSFCQDAFVSRYGKWVVYGILPDNPKAVRTFDRLL